MKIYKMKRSENIFLKNISDIIFLVFSVFSSVYK